MGILGAAMGLGVIFGPMIGAFLSAVSISTPFLASAFSGAVTFILATVLLPESRPQYTGPRPSRWDVMRGQMGVLNLVAFVTSFVIAGFESTFALFIADRFAMGEMAQGYLFALVGVAAAVVQGGIVHRLMKRVGDEPVMVAGMVTIAAGLLLVVAAWSPASLYWLIGVYGVGYGLVKPAVSTLVSKRAAQQGVAIGAMDAMDSLGRVVGPILAGTVYARFNPAAPYWVSVLILGLTLLIFWSMQRRAS
jgi:MFS family permease